MVQIVLIRPGSTDYDDQGRLRNENFEHYHLPSSMDVPKLIVEHQETPSPYTPYGIKGAG